MINVTKTDLPDINKYIKYLEKIWSNGWITNNGEFVRLLERKLEEYLNVKNLLLVSSGTIAIQLALKCLDIKGDVITTPFTFSATTNAIIWEGLGPIFVDIDNETYNVDPRDIEKKITDKTTAILAVHVYGNPCYIEDIQEIADKYNLKIIYDAAHTFGVEYKNESILNCGDISTLSFHATKVFSTVEGGAIVVKDKELFEKLKLLRNFGIKSEEEVVLPGINAKMDEFRAAMGLCNLENIDKKIRLRKIIYDYYKKYLGNGKYNDNIRFQKIIASKYNYSYMPVCFDIIEERDKIYLELKKNDINPRKYFYPLTTNFNYFKKDGIDLVKKYNLKNAFDIANRVLCLPIYPDLDLGEVEKIVNIINNKIMKRN